MDSLASISMNQLIIVLSPKIWILEGVISLFYFDKLFIRYFCGIRVILFGQLSKVFSDLIRSGILV